MKTFSNAVNMLIRFSASLIIIFLSACGIGIKTTINKNYPPLDSLQEVHVLDKGQPIPQGAIEIGTVRIYDKLTIKCDSVTVFNAAKSETRKAGGNVLKIVTHSRPSLASSCHQIMGLILKTNDSVSFANGATKSEDTVASVSFKKPGPQLQEEKGFCFAIRGGYSWQTAKISSNLNSFEKSYMEELKSGAHYGAELNYFYKEQTAVSLQANLFRSDYSTTATATYPNGSSVTGVLSDHISILYIAPGMTWRFLSPTKMNAFLIGFTLGYMHYKDEAQAIEPVTLEGSTLGFSYELGYDIGLSRTLALGLGFAWKIGTLSSVDVTQNGSKQTIKLEDNNRIGIGHLDFSIGLRFR